MNNKSHKAAPTLSQLTYTNCKQANLATIYTGDLRQPWKSGPRFPMVAARLASHQALLLHCREDEIFKLLGMLNSLVESSAALKCAWKMLQKIETQTLEKLSRVLQLPPAGTSRFC